jgi:hypothetical protein
MKLELSADDLRPIIQATVAEAIAQLRADESKLGDRLTFSEGEAAALLSMDQWQLRDERRDKRITASVVRGGKIVYSKSDLMRYLEARRWPVTKG